MTDISESTVITLSTVQAPPDFSDKPVFVLGFVTVPVLTAMYPQAIVSPGDSGSPKTTAFIRPPGLVGSPAFGTLTAYFISLLPQGIAATTAIGTPTVRVTVLPSGVAGSAVVPGPRRADIAYPAGAAEVSAFGSPTLNVSVTAVSIVPSRDVVLGLVTVERNGWVFRSPVNTYQWRLFKEYEGISLLKENGVWSEVAHPDLERTLSAEVYLAGGRDHFVDDATRAELIAEGYTVTEELIP